jgi:hypothetical protein
MCSSSCPACMYAVVDLSHSGLTASCHRGIHSIRQETATRPFTKHAQDLEQDERWIRSIGGSIPRVLAMTHPKPVPTFTVNPTLQFPRYCSAVSGVFLLKTSYRWRSSPQQASESFLHRGLHIPGYTLVHDRASHIIRPHFEQLGRPLRAHLYPGSLQSNTYQLCTAVQHSIEVIHVRRGHTWMLVMKGSSTMRATACIIIASCRVGPRLALPVRKSGASMCTKGSGTNSVMPPVLCCKALQHKFQISGAIRQVNQEL